MYLGTASCWCPLPAQTAVMQQLSLEQRVLLQHFQRRSLPERVHNLMIAHSGLQWLWLWLKSGIICLRSLHRRARR